MSSHPPCVPSRGMAGCRSQLGSSDPKPSAPELRWCLVSMLWPGFLVLAARPAANPPGQKDKHRRKPKGMQNPRGPGNVPMWQWAASCATYGCHMAAWLLGASATSSLLGGGFVSRVLRRSRQEFQHHRRSLARSPRNGDQVGPRCQRDAPIRAATRRMLTVALCSSPPQCCFWSRVLRLSFKPPPPKMKPGAKIRPLVRSCGGAARIHAWLGTTSSLLPPHWGSPACGDG